MFVGYLISSYKLGISNASFAFEKGDETVAEKESVNTSTASTDSTPYAHINKIAEKDNIGTSESDMDSVLMSIDEHFGT